MTACSPTPEPLPNMPSMEPSPTVSPKTFSVPTFNLESLSRQQRIGFEKAFPAKARKAFEEADVISIRGRLTDTDKVLISSVFEKRALLDAIYWDVANSKRKLGPNEAAAACKESGPSITNSKDWPESYSLTISYNCGWFDLNSQSVSASTLFQGRNGYSKPLIADLLRRGNGPK